LRMSLITTASWDEFNICHKDTLKLQKTPISTTVL
jgi:hypothetical protein